MRELYTKSLGYVLSVEAGYVNDPLDPGGATNKGITQRVYDAYRQKQYLPTKSVREIADTEVEAIYRFQYWAAIRGDDLPAGVDYCVFDYAVNSGPRTAAKCLQHAVGVNPDGHIGLVTLGACHTHDLGELIDHICDLRMKFLKVLPTFGHFGRGWTARVEAVRIRAKGMAGHA